MNTYAASAASTQAPRRAHLYVGNLSPRVTEYMLTEIFGVAGLVQHVKIIPDRNYQHGGLNYGFVEYMDMRAAETALQTLNGRKIFDTEIRVNWAYQGNQNKEDTTNHFHVFVGDLSPEVSDEVLQKAFGAFGSLSDARVMWDMNSGKSRGYGFLAFRDRTDAEQAIATMNGEWLGSRAIRVNWANQKTQGLGGPSTGGMGSPSPSDSFGHQMPAMAYTGTAVGGYDPGMMAQPANYNTTVYVGNLAPYTTQADLIPLFQSVGYLQEVRMQADRGFAFIKLDTNEHAQQAINQLQGQLIHGRPIKCSWGKDRDGVAAGAAPMSPTAAASPYGNMMYGMPQANQYSQYGGYGAWGATGAGMPTSASSPGDVGAAGQAGGAAADPSAYYTNYWGGYYGQQAGQAGGQQGA